MMTCNVIVLSNGQIALVDAENYEELSQFNWLCSDGYARRNVYIDRRHSQKVYMHRQILNAPKGLQVDHINGRTLDNRKENLRLCTNAENTRNQRKRNGRYSSSFKGVYWSKKDKRWHSRIMVNYKTISLGSFQDEIEAAKAYDKAAKELFGEFALLNFPESVQHAS